jgi:alpha,alpha-trehalase
VRVGNAAHSQAQHDVWGAVLDSLYLHTKSRDSLPERVWPMVCTQVEAAIANWRKPDRGIWEVRGEPRHFTSSKLMCWVAADRGAKLAELREDWDPADDERVRITVLAIADELTIDGLVLRYRVDETGDGLSGEEGAFTICSFWLVSALCEIGEVERGAICARSCSPTRARSGSTRRRSIRARAATWATSRRRSPTSR